MIALARLKSPAFIAEAQGGVSHVAWGDPATGPLFGYVRGYRAQVELYPISLLGITLGTQGLHRSIEALGRTDSMSAGVGVQALVTVAWCPKSRIGL